MESEPTKPITPAYRWYALLLLTLIYVFNVVDRSILAILQEPIKAELGLSDAQLGMLTGLAFALFYATLAIPIARVADRGLRKGIITGALALWSLMTALCGTAHSFVTLLLFRVGVGVGEAGGVPPATSLIADYFPRDRRATAMSVYGFGPALGIMFGIFAGGWLNEFFGWRTAFYIIGIAGVLLAPIVWFTLRELPRGYSDRIAGQPVAPVQRASFGVVLRTVWRLKALRHLAIAGAAHAFASYSMMNWNPSFYIRVHELGTAEVGTIVGLLAGVAGATGTILGGVLADRFGPKDARWYLWIPAIAMTLIVPFALVQYFVSNVYLSFAIAIAPFLLNMVYIGPTVSMTQSLVEPHMRATAQAVVLMIFNIFGLSLGPFVTGLISDILAVDFGLGTESLRYALSFAILFNLWAAVHYMIGARSLREELDRDRSADAALGARA